MLNLRLYCKTEEQLDMVISHIENAYSCENISTWEPDGDDESEGSFGAFVDGIEAESIKTIELLCEVMVEE